MSGALSAGHGEAGGTGERARLLFRALHLAGFAQGTTVVMLPSLGNVLRDPGVHGLADREYGQLFLPFIVAAIAAGTGFGALARRLGSRALLLAGLSANATAMLLLGATASLLGAPRADRALLGLASLSLGVGFGLALSALNTQVAAHSPGRSDAAVTGLHALVGVGTVVPALLLPWCQRVLAWWLLPLLSAGLLVALVSVVAVLLPPDRSPAAPAPSTRGAAGGRSRRRGFALAALLYGACEAVLGNWGVVYLHGDRGLDSDDSGRALSAFWAAVTVGRGLAVIVARRLPPWRLHASLPLLLSVALLLVALLPRGHAAAAISAFLVAGLGCSAILPLTISRAVQSAPEGGEQVAGALLATFLGGQGIANLLVGWTSGALGVGLAPVFLASAALALGLALLAAALRPSSDGGGR